MPVKMQGFELATLFVAPSDFQYFCEGDPRKLVDVFWAVIELAAISVAPADFHNFFDVVTGHCKNAVNRAGDHFGGTC